MNWDIYFRVLLTVSWGIALFVSATFMGVRDTSHLGWDGKLIFYLLMFSEAAIFSWYLHEFLV